MSLHKTLALGMTRPLFREGNAVKFRSDLSTNDALSNPHEAISVSNSRLFISIKKKKKMFCQKKLNN